jgi:hypothetical protein
MLEREQKEKLDRKTKEKLDRKTKEKLDRKTKEKLDRKTKGWGRVDFMKRNSKYKIDLKTNR